jgi:hypothetical protein
MCDTSTLTLMGPVLRCFRFENNQSRLCIATQRDSVTTTVSQQLSIFSQSGAHACCATHCAASILSQPSSRSLPLALSSLLPRFPFLHLLSPSWLRQPQAGLHLCDSHRLAFTNVVVKWETKQKSAKCATRSNSGTWRLTSVSVCAAGALTRMGAATIRWGKTNAEIQSLGVEQLIALLAGQPISCTTPKLFVMAAAFNPKAEVQVAVEVKATAAVEVETSCMVKRRCRCLQS